MISGSAAAKQDVGLNDLGLAPDVLRVRLAQCIINDRNRAGDFKIPIHLAFGHEALAVAISSIMTEVDQLVLPHRNIHYNLARGASLRAVIDEFALRADGLAGGSLGSMNLFNPDAGIAYTSSILGNNLNVGTGIAYANVVKQTGGMAIIVTGDGAMEEGAFHECLVFLCAQNVPAFVVVENNEWSMATRIDERRAPIDLAALARGYGASYARLSGNNVQSYAETLSGLRTAALTERRPVVVEALVSTLGDWILTNDDNPAGKYINYHAGIAPKIQLAELPAWPVIRQSDDDPVHVLAQRFERNSLEAAARDILAGLMRELP
jgi:pyruvate dehydrogenase E1 component alpha subunit